MLTENVHKVDFTNKKKTKKKNEKKTKNEKNQNAMQIIEQKIRGIALDHQLIP